MQTVNENLLKTSPETHSSKPYGILSDSDNGRAICCLREIYIHRHDKGVLFDFLDDPKRLKHMVEVVKKPDGSGRNFSEPEGQWIFVTHGRIRHEKKETT